MTNRLKTLREKRGLLGAEMEAIIDKAKSENRDLSTAEVVAFNESEKRARVLGLELDEELRSIDIERTKVASTFNHLPVDPQALTEARSALGRYAASGDEGPLQRLNENRSMSAGSDPDGGYIVISAQSTTMTKRMWDVSPMYNLARYVPLTSGDAFEEPLDMDESEANWVAELQTRDDTDTPDLGMFRVPLNEIDALQPVTQKLLDTSYFDVGAWLEGKIGEKFGRKEGTAFVLGDTIQKPQGFLTLTTDAADDVTRDDSKLQHVLTPSTTITADSLRDLYWKMRSAHRKNSTWIMASSTANAIDKLKDGNGDYIWRPGMTAGAQPSLLGLPVEFDENMPAVATGNLPVALGDWKSGYVIVDRPGIRYLRDPFSRKPWVLIYGYRRVGGGVANTDAIKVLKINS